MVLLCVVRVLCDGKKTLWGTHYWSWLLESFSQNHVSVLALVPLTFSWNEAVGGKGGEACRLSLRGNRLWHDDQQLCRRASKHSGVSEELWRRRRTITSLIWQLDSLCQLSFGCVCVCVWGWRLEGLDVKRLLRELMRSPSQASHLWEGRAGQSVPVRHQTEDPALVLHQSSATRLTLLCVRNDGSVLWLSVEAWRFREAPYFPHNKTKQVSGQLSLILRFVECVIRGKRRAQLEVFTSVFPPTPLSSMRQHCPPCQSAPFRPINV